MTPNNGSGASGSDHSNTWVGVWHARITEQRGWAAAHAGIWLACSDARRTPSRRRGPSCPRGVAQAAAQWPLAAARRGPRATPGPRYTHQSTRITKATTRAFPIRGALRKSILRNLGLHYTITHTYNAGQCTHIYLESSNTPTALRRPRHGSGPSTPGPGSAWASPRERPPRSLAPALVPKEY